MYSQNGEDAFVGDYLVTRGIMVEPLVVDVGAGDGTFLSNSRYFIETYGYHGLLIEPHYQAFKKLKSLYEDNDDVKCVKAAVAAKEFKYLLYLDSGEHWSLARLHKSKSKKAKKTRTLVDILKEHKVEDIGILSIDTEGYDTQILAGLLRDSDIRPSVVIIEANDDQEGSNQRDLLSGEYDLIRTMGVNQIFILRSINHT